MQNNNHDNTNNNINVCIMPDEFYFDWIKKIEEERVCLAQLGL